MWQNRIYFDFNFSAIVLTYRQYLYNKILKCTLFQIFIFSNSHYLTYLYSLLFTFLFSHYFIVTLLHSSYSHFFIIIFSHIFTFFSKSHSPIFTFLFSHNYVFPFSHTHILLHSLIITLIFSHLLFSYSH